MVAFAAQSRVTLAYPRRPLRWKLLRARRSWLTRFWDPAEMFGLKATLLLCCFAAGSLIQ